MASTQRGAGYTFTFITSMVFDDGKGVAGTKLDPELLSRFEKVAQLPEEEKNAVLLLLDSVIAKHTIRKVMGS